MIPLVRLGLGKPAVKRPAASLWLGFAFVGTIWPVLDTCGRNRCCWCAGSALDIASVATVPPSQEDAPVTESHWRNCTGGVERPARTVLTL